MSASDDSIRVKSTVRLTIELQNDYVSNGENEAEYYWYASRGAFINQVNKENYSSVIWIAPKDTGMYKVGCNVLRGDAEESAYRYIHVAEFDQLEDDSFISGDIGNRHLKIDNSPYYVIGDINIVSAAQLEIDGNVEIRFCGFFQFLVEGDVILNSTPEFPIIFTTSQMNQIWKGIQTNHNIGMENVIIENSNIAYNCTDDYAEGRLEFIYFKNNNIAVEASSHTVVHCMFEKNKYCIYGGRNNIQNNLFCDNAYVFLYNSGIIVNNTIHMNNVVYYICHCADISNNIISENKYVFVIADDQDTYFYNCFWLNNITNARINSTNTYWDSNYPDLDELYQPEEADWPDSLNICESPQFRSGRNSSLFLDSDSPCINSGNPESEYNDFDGSRNDIGAYGGSDGNWTPCWDFQTDDDFYENCFLIELKMYKDSILQRTKLLRYVIYPWQNQETIENTQTDDLYKLLSIDGKSLYQYHASTGRWIFIASSLWDQSFEGTTYTQIDIFENCRELVTLHLPGYTISKEGFDSYNTSLLYKGECE